ncbi:site-specific integrase [Micromonospora sp. WMMC415]|uniref:tyrosine-type recombinase/integrase n=1 Tax=Micromonospora sp. WMMC415 TaxID=2675222 RepID=UPI001E2FE990|nr:site-specific integrase [Micromonospora sp. WMMC415]
MAAFPAPASGVVPTDQLVLRAAATPAFLGRYRGQTRVHTESDLRVFLRWCTDQDLDPLAAARVDVERYVRWLQDVRRYQPSTVSRRLSVVVGFYRVCVIDAILDHSPADYVRRPTVPAESPTLGLGHLQFEALITTARLSSNPNDFALVALLGLLGLRIFEACGASIADLGEEHGHRVLRVRGKGGKVVLVPLPPAVARAIDGPSTTAPPGRSFATPSASRWTATPPPAGSSTWPTPPGSGCQGCIPTCSATRS